MLLEDAVEHGALGPPLPPGGVAERQGTGSLLAGHDTHGDVVLRQGSQVRQRLPGGARLPPHALNDPFSDGTTHFVWPPDAFLARLAALIPRPRKHLLTYHGVLAPNHRWRRSIVARPRPKVRRNGKVTSRPRLSHSQALLRAYGFFFRRCDHCGGSKRILAVITDPPVVRAILAHIGHDPEPPRLAPPRAPPADLFST
ncbi:MAG: hypothetical protein V1912_05110 [bacterium]